jgi:hypothetical protein
VAHARGAREAGRAASSSLDVWSFYIFPRGPVGKQGLFLGVLGVLASRIYWLCMTENAVAKEIVDVAYRLHTVLGPGLFESVKVIVEIKSIAEIAPPHKKQASHLPAASGQTTGLVDQFQCSEDQGRHYTDC